MQIEVPQDHGSRCPKIVRMVVEIPKLSGNKYEYDPSIVDLDGVDKHRVREIEHFFLIASSRHRFLKKTQAEAKASTAG